MRARVTAWKKMQTRSWHRSALRSRGRGMDNPREILIDPSEVEFHLKDGTLTHISYRGWDFQIESFDYMRHRVKRYRDLSSPRAGFSREDLPGVTGADLIRERVAAMSNHEQLEFIASTQRGTPAGKLTQLLEAWEPIDEELPEITDPIASDDEDDCP